MNELLLSWLQIINNIMMLQAIPSNHQGSFSATANTLVFFISQCASTIRKVMMQTSIIASVDSSAVPAFTGENIELSIRQADVKSGDLKNTQVTLIKKKVIMARARFERYLFRRMAEPGISFTFAYARVDTLEVETSFTNFSTHKYIP